jgi:Fe-S cluster biogenesis protein NfuA
MNRYINLYTEANPNPNSMKFVANVMLAEEGITYDFPTAESATDSPIALELFTLPYVQRVFIMNNFVTVTKSEQYHWHDIIGQLKAQIKQYLEEDKPIIKSDLANSLKINHDEPEIDRKIKQILDEYVRPAVETDGGFIGFHSFEQNTGVVKVLLQGSCSGCPSSTVTLKMGIENLLKRMVPEVQTVVAEGI